MKLLLFAALAATAFGACTLPEDLGAHIVGHSGMTPCEAGATLANGETCTVTCADGYYGSDSVNDISYTCNADADVFDAEAQLGCDDQCDQMAIDYACQLTTCDLSGGTNEVCAQAYPGYYASVDGQEVFKCATLENCLHATCTEANDAVCAVGAAGFYGGQICRAAGLARCEAASGDDHSGCAHATEADCVADTDDGAEGACQWIAGATDHSGCAHATQVDCEADADDSMCSIATCGAGTDEACTTQVDCEAAVDADGAAGVWNGSGACQWVHAGVPCSPEPGCMEGGVTCTTDDDQICNDMCGQGYFYVGDQYCEDWTLDQDLIYHPDDNTHSIWVDNEGDGCQAYMASGWCGDTTNGNYAWGWVNGSNCPMETVHGMVCTEPDEEMWYPITADMACCGCRDLGGGHCSECEGITDCDPEKLFCSGVNEDGTQKNPSECTKCTSADNGCVLAPCPNGTNTSADGLECEQVPCPDNSQGESSCSCDVGYVFEPSAENSMGAWSIQWSGRECTEQDGLTLGADGIMGASPTGAAHWVGECAQAAEGTYGCETGEYMWEGICYRCDEGIPGDTAQEREHFLSMYGWHRWLDWAAEGVGSFCELQCKDDDAMGEGLGTHDTVDDQHMCLGKRCFPAPNDDGTCPEDAGAPCHHVSPEGVASGQYSPDCEFSKSPYHQDCYIICDTPGWVMAEARGVIGLYCRAGDDGIEQVIEGALPTCVEGMCTQWEGIRDNECYSCPKGRRRDETYSAAISVCQPKHESPVDTECNPTAADQAACELDGDADTGCEWVGTSVCDITVGSEESYYVFEEPMTCKSVRGTAQTECEGEEDFTEDECAAAANCEWVVNRMKNVISSCFVGHEGHVSWFQGDWSGCIEWSLPLDACQGIYAQKLSTTDMDPVRCGIQGGECEQADDTAACDAQVSANISSCQHGLDAGVASRTAVGELDYATLLASATCESREEPAEGEEPAENTDCTDDYDFAARLPGVAGMVDAAGASAWGFTDEQIQKYDSLYDFERQAHGADYGYIRFACNADTGVCDIDPAQTAGQMWQRDIIALFTEVSDADIQNRRDLGDSQFTTNDYNALMNVRRCIAGDCGSGKKKDDKKPGPKNPNAKPTGKCEPLDGCGDIETCTGTAESCGAHNKDQCVNDKDNCHWVGGKKGGEEDESSPTKVISSFVAAVAGAAILLL